MSENSGSAGDRFWNFSLDRYRRPGVAEICLVMQDEAGVDVNLLLFCLWCGQEGVALEAEDIAALDDAGPGAWREQVVRPLRAARRAMKEPPTAFEPSETERLRTALKHVEIESERLQQMVLADTAEAMGLLEKADRSTLPDAAAAQANATVYLAFLAGNPSGSQAGRLNELIRLTID